MKNTATNQYKHLPTRCNTLSISSFHSMSHYSVSKIEPDNSNEEENDWYHITRSPTPPKIIMKEKKKITYETRAILEDLVLVTDIPP